MSLLPRLIVACCLLALGACMEGKMEVHLITGREQVIQNPDYPQTSSDPLTSLDWDIVSPEGTQITMDCQDIRVTVSQNCNKGYFSVQHSGGEKTPLYCGAIGGLKIASTNNRMSIHFELIWAAGVLNCKVKAERATTNVPAPAESKIPSEKIHVNVDEVRYNDIRVNPLPQVDKVYHWEYITKPGYKIGIRCPFLWMGHQHPTSECTDDYFSFDLGGKVVKLCNNSNDVTLVSTGESLGITVKTTSKVMGGIQCIVLATTGPHFEQYKNEPELEEEDSAEYGHPKVKGTKTTTCECGLSNKPPPARMLHGIDVSPHEFPWMAGLLKSEKALQTFCGGTIITKRHVVTAAHCIKLTKPTHVVVGTDHMGKKEGGKIYPVEKIISHDFKDGYATTNDIALLIIAEEMQFGRFVGAACMPNRKLNLVNQHVVAMGWGGIAVDEKHRDQRQLKKAKLRVISMESCNPVWDGRWAVKPQTYICTWNKNQDVCYGDSGGPVVWLDPETNRYTLVGIPAVCDGCRLEKPSLHTALDHYFPWIWSTIRDNNYGYEEVCSKIG